MKKKQITIEKGITIESFKRQGRRRPEADALLKMDIGDSFVSDSRDKLFSVANWFGIKIKTRKFFEAETKKWKFRVWKVANEKST